MSGLAQHVVEHRGPDDEPAVPRPAHPGHDRACRILDDEREGPRDVLVVKRLDPFRGGRHRGGVHESKWTRSQMLDAAEKSGAPAGRDAVGRTTCVNGGSTTLERHRRRHRCVCRTSRSEPPTGRRSRRPSTRGRAAMPIGAPASSGGSGSGWSSTPRATWPIIGARRVTCCCASEGELLTELADGRTFTLIPGTSYQVADGAEPHRSSTSVGAKLFVVD